MVVDVDPLAAMNDKAWNEAMIEELKAIVKNNTWEFTQLPNDKKAIYAKWVFKLKMNPEGKIVKHKARL
ncbi:copia-type polyprotein, partial [Trifolium medium]|nr:copia-type polyprotein [Trifolium medium]